MVFIEILPATYVFQGGGWLCFLQMGLFSFDEETHVSLQRKPCVLESGSSCTLFPCENSVNF
jgi:hypothetical protein